MSKRSAITGFLLVLRFSVLLTDICSKNVLFTSKVVELYDQDLRQYTKETSVQFNIGLKETVCFQVEEKNSGFSSGKTFYLTFNDVESIFTYKNSYDFAVADPKVTCICDCPGLEDHCSPNRDSCAEDGRAGDNTCYNYYKGDLASDGCGLFAPVGSSSICCSIGFEAFMKQRYRAFEISTPVTRGSFTMQTQAGVREFEADLDKGSKIFMDEVSISFETPGKIIPIPDGWYCGRADSDEVLTNVKINGLNEWDINRLGWLKYNTNDELQYMATEVKPVFNAETVNCKENIVNVNFASDYSNRMIVESKPLEKYYASTVRTAIRKDMNRDVVVSFRQFDRMKVMLIFPGVRDIIQHFSNSNFKDFSGVAILDKHSNRVLNITVFEGRGTLYGTMRVAETPVETFDFTIPANSTWQYSNFVQITQWCSNNGRTKLCFHTGDSDKEVCKEIFCNSEENSQFEIPKNAIDYKVGSRESLADIKTWQRYCNPVEWFNGINGLQEATCMLAVLVLCAIIVFITFLIVKKTPCLFCVNRLVQMSPCYGIITEIFPSVRRCYEYSDEENSSSTEENNKKKYTLAQHRPGRFSKFLVKLKIRKKDKEDSYSGSEENYYVDISDIDLDLARHSRDTYDKYDTTDSYTDDRYSRSEGSSLENEYSSFPRR